MIKHLLIFCTFTAMLGWIIADPDFKMTIEKIEVLSYDKDWVKDPSFVIFQYNATHQACNASSHLLQDLDYEFKENIEVFAVEDKGEPRLLSTMNDVNICDIMTSGYPEIEEMFKIGNLTKCPIKKGFYMGTNAILDTSNVPPSVPRGKFMVDIKSYHGSVYLSHVQTFAKVEDVPEAK